MKRYILLAYLVTFSIGAAQAQTDSPYKTSFKKDAPITIAAMGLSYYGLTLMQDKDGLTEEEVGRLDRKNVNGFDRFSAGYHSETANKISDFPFYGSFALPITLLLNDNVRSHAGQVFGLYVQTMAITGTLFTLTNGNFPRTRPLAYSPEVDISKKQTANARSSFYAGHTAAAASASFFFAKVFHDFNPDSPARPYVWAVAAAIPATVGYYRLKAGKHFLSDNILGYTMGAAAGILVPQLHKKKNNTGLSISPTLIPTLEGTAFQGANLSYTF